MSFLWAYVASDIWSGCHHLLKFQFYNESLPILNQINGGCGTSLLLILSTLSNYTIKARPDQQGITALSHKMLFHCHIHLHHTIRNIWWVLWENRPVQGSKQGCTCHLTSTPLDRKNSFELFLSGINKIYILWLARNYNWVLNPSRKTSCL